MRALLLLLDSLGCGEPRNASSGGSGAEALARLFAARPELELPHLFSLGLWKIVTGDVLAPRSQGTHACWGRLRPRWSGADAVTSHWELAGAVSPKLFVSFTQPPEELLNALARACHVRFLVIDPSADEEAKALLMREHRVSGRPCLFTSAESELEIFAEADVVPLPRLLEICRLARRVADRWRIRMVAARPAVPAGENVIHIHRHEFAMVPPRTILNAIAERGLHVHGIGQVNGIFAGSGVTRSTRISSEAEGLAFVETAWSGESDGLIFASLSGLGAARGGEIEAAAEALSELDAWLGGFLPAVEPEDLVLLTGIPRAAASTPDSPAPVEVPLIMLHGGKAGPLGTRSTFADVAASLAQFYGLPPWPAGSSFLRGGT